MNTQADLQDQVQWHETAETKNIRLQMQPNTGLTHTTTPRLESQNVYTLSSCSPQDCSYTGTRSTQASLGQHAFDQDTLCEIMQNEITTMLVQQQMPASLPQKDIIVFDGDPLKYISFSH